MSDERFDLLLEKYLDGALTPTEREEFQALLQRDSDLRAQYISVLTQASILRRIHRKKATESARNELSDIRLAQNQLKKKKPHSAEKTNFGPALKIGVAVAALVAIVFTIQISRQGSVPSDSAVSNTNSEPKAKVVDVQDIFVDANTEKRLSAEDLAGRKVITRENASAVIHYKDGTSVELEANTKVQLSSVDPQKGKVVEALTGRVIVNAVPQPKDRPLQIVSAHGRATVLGTLFWLSVDDQGTRVDLLKGKVSLIRTSDSATLQLAEGQRAVLAPGTVLAAEPLKLKNGKLLYREEFSPELNNWSKSGLTLDIGKIENENPELSTIKLTPTRDQESSVTLSFSQALARTPDSLSIEYRMRSLPPYRNVNMIHVGIDSNGAAETSVEEDLTDNNKYTFIRFKWVKCRLEISRSTDGDGNPMSHYRSYFGNVFKYSRVAKGPALGMKFVLKNLPVEISDLRIYELVPDK